MGNPQFLPLFFPSYFPLFALLLFRSWREGGNFSSLLLFFFPFFFLPRGSRPFGKAKLINSSEWATKKPTPKPDRPQVRAGWSEGKRDKSVSVCACACACARVSGRDEETKTQIGVRTGSSIFLSFSSLPPLVPGGKCGFLIIMQGSFARVL
ncbi:hypothetical protein F4809DRAFT_62503 [Biscogniauxia mediterranea]|nr:hypothetical protein F4809DRAFT_62503 [Biscogniauxia mediterranea]